MNVRGAGSFLVMTALAAATATLTPAQGSKAADNNPDVVEARNYKLTMNKLERLAAAAEDLNKALAADPALKGRVESGSSDDKSIDEKAREIDAKFPQLAAMLRPHGFATREWIVINIAFLNDMIVVGMKKQGALKEYPPNTITAENAAFVEANYDKLQEIGKKLTPQDSESQ